MNLEVPGRAADRAGVAVPLPRRRSRFLPSRRVASAPRPLLPRQLPVVLPSANGTPIANPGRLV